ncbi:GNAT family N-acetyltransferase [Micromonospora sp. LZ34]
MSAVEVRRAAAGDASEIARLSGELGYRVEAEDVGRRLAGLSAGHVVLVAADAERVLGWLHACRTTSVLHGDRMEIAGLVVAADQHGRGVGSALVAAAERWALQQGVHTVRVLSGSERLAAHGFYRGRGYREVKTEQAFMKALPLG